MAQTQLQSFERSRRRALVPDALEILAVGAQCLEKFDERGPRALTGGEKSEVTSRANRDVLKVLVEQPPLRIHEQAPDVVRPKGTLVIVKAEKRIGLLVVGKDVPERTPKHHGDATPIHHRSQVRIHHKRIRWRWRQGGFADQKEEV